MSANTDHPWHIGSSHKIIDGRTKYPMMPATIATFRSSGMRKSLSALKYIYGNRVESNLKYQ